MSNITRAAALAALASICLGALPAAAQSAAAIEGVWKTTRVVITGADPLTIESPQANLSVYSRGYYSAVSDTSPTPRTAAPAFKDTAKPTDAEKLAKYGEWSPLNAQAGTYEVKGGMLTRHPIVAKNLAALSAPVQSAEIKLSGNTLVIVSKSLPGLPAREQTVTLTRVK